MLLEECCWEFQEGGNQRREEQRKTRDLKEPVSRRFQRRRSVAGMGCCWKDLWRTSDFGLEGKSMRGLPALSVAAKLGLIISLALFSMSLAVYLALQHCQPRNGDQVMHKIGLVERVPAEASGELAM